MSEMNQPSRAGADSYITPVTCAALGRLSRRQRTAIRLHYVEGLTRTETAAQMGVSAQKVLIYVRRGKAKLRALDLPIPAKPGGVFRDAA